MALEVLPCNEEPHVYEKLSSSDSNDARCVFINFVLQYNKRHISHSSHIIMSAFFTCCTLVENGSVFLGFLRLRDMVDVLQ